jgi:hypothetical protein
MAESAAAETLFGTDIFDVIPHIERRTVVLDLRGIVERQAISQRPLARTAGRPALRVLAGRMWSSGVLLDKRLPACSKHVTGKLLQADRLDGHAVTRLVYDINDDVGQREVAVGTSLDARVTYFMLQCPRRASVPVSVL